MIRAAVAVAAFCAASPAAGQIVSPLTPGGAIDTSNLATKAEVQAMQASIPSTTTLATKAEVATIQATIPTASTEIPLASTDMGSAGTNPMKFAMEKHDHPSKGRKGRVAINAEFVTWTFGTPFAAGEIPVCLANAEVATGATELVNVQVYGVPTNTRCVFQVTRISRGVVGLIPNVLSINLTPYSGFIHMRAESQ